jgi:hypothetical protein
MQKTDAGNICTFVSRKARNLPHYYENYNEASLPSDFQPITASCDLRSECTLEGHFQVQPIAAVFGVLSRCHRPPEFDSGSEINLEQVASVLFESHMH